jgi:hypothetical protein
MKRKTIRVQCTVSPMIGVYLDELQQCGTFGDTRAEVVRRVLCSGIMEALSGETIARLCREHKP